MIITYFQQLPDGKRITNTPLKMAAERKYFMRLKIQTVVQECVAALYDHLIWKYWIFIKTRSYIWDVNSLVILVVFRVAYRWNFDSHWMPIILAWNLIFYAFCQKIEVYLHDGKLAGTVEQTWSFCTPKFDIKDANGVTILKVKGPICTLKCCSDVNFKVGLI